MNHSKRKSRFTSSKIHALIPYGKVKMTDDELKQWKKDNPKSRVTTKVGGFSTTGLTYIEEINIEKKLKRSLSLNVYSRAISWGHIMEHVCYDKLEMYYDLVSLATVSHHDPEFSEIWAGTPDYTISDQVIAEQKSYQLKNFSKYTDCLMKKDISLFRKEFPQEYWQIVSNCCIQNMEIGEAISFMPYRSTVLELRKRIMEEDILDRWGYADNPWRFKFIVDEEMRNLPWIRQGGYYKEITKFRFVIPDEDKELLTARVREASKLINKDER